MCDLVIIKTFDQNQAASIPIDDEPLKVSTYSVLDSHTITMFPGLAEIVISTFCAVFSETVYLMLKQNTHRLASLYFIFIIKIMCK